MSQQILDFATGALFRFCFAIMVLGVLRLIFITIGGMRSAYKNANDKSIPFGEVMKETLLWLIPAKNVFSTQVIFSIISFSFHVCMIIVTFFLYEHVLLWRSGTGLHWPVLVDAVADALAIIVIITGMILLGIRIFNTTRRFMSTNQDYLVMILILLVFTTGFMAGRTINPFSYSTTIVLHVFSGNLLMVLIPFTKLSHSVMYPLMRIANAVAWKLPAGTVERLNQTLYGENIKKI